MYAVRSSASGRREKLTTAVWSLPRVCLFACLFSLHRAFNHVHFLLSEGTGWTPDLEG